MNSENKGGNHDAKMKQTNLKKSIQPTMENSECRIRRNNGLQQLYGKSRIREVKIWQE